MVSKASVIGIDLGSAESYVAYVGKGLVDVVQNEMSKRNNPTLAGFTSRERLLGDAALSQIKSNAKNTCRNMKHLLGQRLDAPDVEKEKFWSTCPLAEAADGYAGYEVEYKDEQRTFSATQITAMFLTKLREITEGWCQSKVADVVIGVPSYYSDVHRQALLDAAKIANISVLRLMNEHTATALAYGIYRSNDFDPEKPTTVVFCSMGHTIFSVSIMNFVKGKVTILCEASDKVGGRDMDECLMREFGAQFHKKVGCDPLSNKKASFKLEDAVTKTKKVLSANYEANMSCECLMEDEDFSSQINRDTFEQMCQPMMKKVQDVLDRAKATCGIPHEQIEFVEMVGGASRVPWLKKMCSEAFGDKELSFTMNADESVARGCALQAAMLSPLFKVRDFKVEDNSPYGISLGWMGSAADAEAKDASAKDASAEAEDVDMKLGGADGEYKTATVFQPGSAMNSARMLTFNRKGPFDLKAEYTDAQALVPGTPTDLGTYKIELAPSAEVKKVKVKAKLSIHGIFEIENAQIVEEEEYEEVTKEKRELPAEAEAATAAEEEAPKPESEAPKEEAVGEAQEGDDKDKESKPEEKKADKPAEKKYEWVEVKKTKRRTKKTDLVVTSTGRVGHAGPVIQALMDEETKMQVEMKEIIESDEKRNDLEGYIFNTRDKVSGAWSEFITDADRESFQRELENAENWLYDTTDPTKVMFVDKLDELKKTGDPVQWRANEDNVRGEWISAVEGTIVNYKAAGETPDEKYGHISPEKLTKIVQSCDDLKVWLEDLKAKQSAMAKTEKPVLLCSEMEKKNQELAAFANDILKEPKPAPPKEEKKEEKMEEAAGEEKKDEAAPEAPKNDVDID